MIHYLFRKLNRALSVVAFLSLAACGGGGAGSSLTGTVTTPGTTTGTTTTTSSYSIALSASSLSVTALLPSTITAIVKDSQGNPLQGIPVTFTLGSNLSGGTLATTPTTTDVNGKTSLIYTAGKTAGTDTILAQATDSAGKVAYGSVSIAVSNTSGLSVGLTSSNSTVNSGQISTLSALVKDANNLPVAGQLVNFALGSNLTGATLSAPQATTDNTGTAQVNYTAGTIAGTDRIISSVTATNGQQASGYTAITVTSVNKAALYSVTLTPATTTVTHGTTYPFTAKVVTNDVNGIPTSTPVPQGTQVNFKFGSAQSGAPQLNTIGLAPSLTTATGYTDALGQVYVTYLAGANTGTDALVASVTDNNAVTVSSTSTITVN